jgi:hypothetical protein
MTTTAAWWRAGGKSDLDLRRRQPCAAERIGGRPKYPSHRSACDGRVSLRRPQQRETGLWLTAEAAGAPVARLGRGERATRPVHLRPLVERRCRGLRVDPLPTPLRRLG